MVKCRKCIHWVKNESDENGDCRINPPQVFEVGMNMSTLDYETISIFPETKPNCFCSRGTEIQTNPFSELKEE